MNVFLYKLLLHLNIYRDVSNADSLQCLYIMFIVHVVFIKLWHSSIASMFRAGSVFSFQSFSVSRSVIMFSYISPVEMRPNINAQGNHTPKWGPTLNEIK